jgi:hypothetical protein
MVEQAFPLLFSFSIVKADYLESLGIQVNIYIYCDYN